MVFNRDWGLRKSRGAEEAEEAEEAEANLCMDSPPLPTLHQFLNFVGAARCQRYFEF